MWEKQRHVHLLHYNFRPLDCEEGDKHIERELKQESNNDENKEQGGGNDENKDEDKNDGEDKDN